MQIKEKYDLTIFMIEHHMDLVMKFSDRIYVVDFGKTDRRRARPPRCSDDPESH